MPQPFRYAVIAGVLASLAVPSAAQSGSPVRDNLQLNAEAIATQRRVLVGGSLPLTEQESGGFWPLYDDYHAKLSPLTDRTAAVIAEVVDSGAVLTEARAAELLKEAIALEESELKLKKRHFERLRKVLPPRKLALYFQLESKLDALVRADLANAVPLISVGRN